MAYKAIEMLEEIRESQRELVKVAKTDAVLKKDYLTEEEAALYLDCKVAYVKKIMRGNGNGPLVPYYMASGNNSYIARVDLDRFITKTRIRSEEEINSAVYRKRS